MRVWMIGVKDRSWFLREGLFAKYVTALVGLVVFVLAVNGAMETWINYRATKSSLTDAMGEKAEATARRIEQSVADLERQISWVTRASARTTADHYADYAQLLKQAPAVSQLSYLDGYGREQLSLSRTAISVESKADSPAISDFTYTIGKSVSYAPAFFRDSLPLMSISVAHSGFNAGVTVAEIDLRFLSDFLGDAQVGRSTFAYVVDPHGQVLASSSKGPDVGRFLAGTPQVDAVITAGRRGAGLGQGHRRPRRPDSGERGAELGWYVFFEQPTAQALAPIRDQLVRGALLIALGLAVAIAAGTALARRMLVPITALRRGARRLGEGDFSHRIDVQTKDELEELADQFNSMAGQLQETYSGLETKVQERTRDLAQSINELKVLEEVGRAVASSLDLNAVLPTVAARALEITHADAVLIYGYDVTKRQFNLAEAIGIDKSAQGDHLAIDEDTTVLGEAARKGEPIAIADLSHAAETLLRDVAVTAGFHAVLVVPLVDQQGVLGSLVVLRRASGEFSPT